MTHIYALPFTSSLKERSSIVDSPGPTQETAHRVDKLSMYQSPRHQEERSGSNLLKRRSMGSELKGSSNELPVIDSKIGSMYQTTNVATQHQTREQLPPLSSLFGNHSSHHNRPSQSPYSDRHSPIYSARSPHESRQPMTSTHLDRAYEGSYFHRPSATQPAPYSSRVEPVEGSGFQPPARPRTTGTSPTSPGYDSHYSSADASRSQPASTNSWTPQSHERRSQYFAKATSSSFNSRSEDSSSSIRTGDARPPFRDGDLPPTPTYPPTPASVIAGEISTSKDGLGPKIWTGTQFLPRFVRQAEVPGEGLCYFYDDGTHCKTVIDGEIVNAHWGVTKAGKPRKRLAIACITCREKKIKCDPDYPRCVQCEKFGRVCKFKNVPRGGQGSPDTPPAEADDSLAHPESLRIESEPFRLEKREASSSTSPRQTLRDPTPESETHNSKRQRNGYSEFTPVASEASPQPSALEPVSPTKTCNMPLITSAIDHNVSREWQQNPFVTNPSLVTELVTIYFKHGPETCHDMYPPGPFKKWFFSTSEKSLDDLMLLYSILAVATVFSPKSEHKALGINYASISRYACGNRQFSLQLVQSRLILSVYYFSINIVNDSWDYSGAALRAAGRLRLNIEMEKSEDALLESFPYGLSRIGYAECRRRTFFHCYLMDKFLTFNSGLLSYLSAQDVFLRLPCDSKSFEDQVDVQNPLFDCSTSEIPDSNRTIGLISYMINITTIYGDVMANIYRNSQQSPLSLSTSTFVAFYDKTSYRLRQWKDSLPSRYQFSAHNVQNSMQSGNLGMFMSMHTIYHTAAMKLNRYIQRSTFTVTQINHHIKISKSHARETLKMIDVLGEFRPIPNAVDANRVDSAATKFTSPFVGYSILSAIDILTAKVEQAEVPSLLSSINGSLSLLAELASSWESAKSHQALVLQRMKDLAGLTTGDNNKHPAAATEGSDGVFHMKKALETTFAKGYDSFYV